MNKAISILLALVTVQASATPVHICGTSAVDYTSVTIEKCTKPPCTVKVGETISYSLKFTPSSAVKDLTAHVEVSAFGIIIPIFDGPICSKIFLARNDSLFPCPLCPEVEYIYRDTIHVPTLPPAISGTIRLTLESSWETIKCIEVAGKSESDEN